MTNMALDLVQVGMSALRPKPKAVAAVPEPAIANGGAGGERRSRSRRRGRSSSSRHRRRGRSHSRHRRRGRSSSSRRGRSRSRGRCRGRRQSRRHSRHASPSDSRSATPRPAVNDGPSSKGYIGKFFQGHKLRREATSLGALSIDVLMEALHLLDSQRWLDHDIANINVKVIFLKRYMLYSNFNVIDAKGRRVSVFHPQVHEFRALQSSKLWQHTAQGRLGAVPLRMYQTDTAIPNPTSFAAECSRIF